MNALPPSLALRSIQDTCAGRSPIVVPLLVDMYLNSIQPLTPPGAQYSASGTPDTMAPVSMGVNCQLFKCSLNTDLSPPSGFRRRGTELFSAAMINRPIILGLINPHNTEPLYIRPTGCSGYRIASFLREFSPLTEEDYLKLFDRRNLLLSNEDDPHIAADAFRSTLKEGDQVILLGEAVRRALDLPKMFIHPITVDGVTYRQIPHPSGLTRFYNDAVARQLVAMMFLDLLGGEDADTVG